MRHVTLLLIIALLSCETKEHADAELGALNKAKTNAAKLSARASMSEAQEIGIPECDTYVRNYESCLGKVPEERKETLRATLSEQRNKWQNEVTSGQDRNTIVEECRSAVAPARQAMGEYGCSW